MSAGDIFLTLRYLSSSNLKFKRFSIYQASLHNVTCRPKIALIPSPCFFVYFQTNTKYWIKKRKKKV